MLDPFGSAGPGSSLMDRIDGYSGSEVLTPPTRTTVLLVEDEAELRELFGLSLTRAGYDVVYAADGKEVLDRLASSFASEGHFGRFDVVVSDIRMPGFSGLHLLVALHHWSPGLPVILMTAFADESTRRDAHRLGAAAVLSKPFQLLALASAVEQARSAPHTVRPSPEP